MKSATWTIMADKITVSMPKQGKHDVAYKLDPTKKPKQIDFTPLDGPPNEKGKTGHGLYSLEGDVLKLCMPKGPDADERPTELRTEEGGKAFLITLKREKPVKDKPKEDKPEADKQAIQGTWQVTDVETKDKKTPDPTGALKKIKTQQWTFRRRHGHRPDARREGHPARRLHAGPVPKPKGNHPHGARRSGDGHLQSGGRRSQTVLSGPAGGPKPTELAADDAGKNILLTLKRVTADKEKPKEDKPKDDAKVKKLLQDWCDVAKKEYEMRKTRYQSGLSSIEPVAASARRVLTAELARSDNKEDRVKACEAYLQQTTDMAKIAKLQWQAGSLPHADALEAEYHRLEAEVMLEREKAK